MIRSAFIQRGLSIRESEVAELVANGLSNKQVAEKLFVTEKTIKFHLTNIYRKMGLTSRTQLILWSLPHLQFVPAVTMGAGIHSGAPESSTTDQRSISASVAGNQAMDANGGGAHDEQGSSSFPGGVGTQGELPIGLAESEIKDVKVS